MLKKNTKNETKKETMTKACARKPKDYAKAIVPETATLGGNTGCSLTEQK